MPHLEETDRYLQVLADPFSGSRRGMSITREMVRPAWCDGNRFHQFVKEATMAIQEGKAAPAFTLPDANGTRWHFRGGAMGTSMK